jgi:hypothetical protein
MRGPSAQAHLLEIDDSRLPVDLGVAETLGSAANRLAVRHERRSEVS